MSDQDRTTDALSELLRGERRRSTTLTLCLLLLGLAVVAALWRMGERTSASEDSGTRTTDVVALMALREEWRATQERLEARIRELEGVVASSDQDEGSQDQKGDNGGATAAPPPATINLTGRPDPSRDRGASSTGGDPGRPWQDSVARALRIGEQVREDLDREQQRNGDQASRDQETGDQGSDSSSSPEEEAPGEEDRATTPSDAKDISVPLLTSVNQFLEDSGLARYRLVEAKEHPVDAGLFDVLLALRPDSGNAGGTVEAERVWLRVHPVSREAQWILEGAQGTSGGVRIEYPHRTLVIDIAGVVPPDLVPEALAEVLGLRGPRILPMPLMDTPRVTERFNRRLAEEKLELRVVSIGSTEDDTLVDLVVDLGRVPGRDQREEVRAARAWWELNEDRRQLTLICEDGTLALDGVVRPFFRGTWRRSYPNIHPEAWRTLPAVRLKELPGPAPSGPAPSGSGN